MSEIHSMSSKIEDKMYDKLVGNEKLQIYKQRKAEILRKQGAEDFRFCSKSVSYVQEEKENSLDDNIPTPVPSENIPIPEEKPEKSTVKKSKSNLKISKVPSKATSSISSAQKPSAGSRKLKLQRIQH
jgi:hypothetical protein